MISSPGLSSEWSLLWVVSPQGGFSSGWSLLWVVSPLGGLSSVFLHQCGLSSGWSHEGGLSSKWSVIRVVSHQSGLSSRWFLIKVVFYHGGLLSSWSLIKVVFYQSGLSSGWSIIRVVCHHGGLSSGWSIIRVVCHQGGLSSEWFIIRVVCHQGGLSSEWSLIKVVFYQAGLSSGGLSSDVPLGYKQNTDTTEESGCSVSLFFTLCLFPPWFWAGALSPRRQRWGSTTQRSCRPSWLPTCWSHHSTSCSGSWSLQRIKQYRVIRSCTEAVLLVTAPTLRKCYFLIGKCCHSVLVCQTFGTGQEEQVKQEEQLQGSNKLREM